MKKSISMGGSNFQNIRTSNIQNCKKKEVDRLSEDRKTADRFLG